MPRDEPFAVSVSNRKMPFDTLRANVGILDMPRDEPFAVSVSNRKMPFDRLRANVGILIEQQLYYLTKGRMPCKKSSRSC